MSARRTTKTSSRGPNIGRVRDIEWVGGRLAAPFLLPGGRVPLRPDVVVWLSPRDGRVLTCELAYPDDPVDVLANALVRAMAHPVARGPAGPMRLRVSDPIAAESLQARFGDALEVRVAPTPEVERAVRSIATRIGGRGEAAGYLSGGQISEPAVAAFFRAAAALYRLAPWRLIRDDVQVLQLDVPDFGVRGGVVSIIGALGESRGLLLFDSAESYLRLVRAARGAAGNDSLLGRLGLRLFSLTYERGADLPVVMRREIVCHGWEVADARAYPRLARLEPDQIAQPLGEADLVLGTLCADAICRFCDRHRSIFSAFRPPPLSEALEVETVSGRHRTVVTAPHPEAGWEG